MLEVLNALLYIFVFIVYWNKHKTLDAFLFIWAAFTVTSVMCALNSIYGNPEFRNTTILPYIYLFVCIFVYLNAFRCFTLKDKLLLHETSGIKLLSWIFILSGIASIYYTLPSAVELIQSGEWGMLRQMVYEESDEVQLYQSALERIVKNIHGYLSPFGVVMCFYYLSDKSINRLKTALIWIAWIVPSFLGAMLVASRGLVVAQMLTIALCFVLFKDLISIKVKRIFTIVMIVFSIPVILYTIAVTVSRFGDDEAGSSAFDYLGHSMMAFNHGIASMREFMWGNYSMSFFQKLFGIHSHFDFKSAGYDAGTAFYTFIGCIYLDCGPIFTFLIGLVFFSVMRKFLTKRNLKVSDLVVIVFVLVNLTRGVFVWGKGYALSWVMMVVVFYIVKFVERSSVKVKIR